MDYYKDSYIYKNPYLLTSKINDEFYVIYNRFINNGKVININQYKILESIQKNDTLSNLACRNNLTLEEIFFLSKILEEKEILKFDDSFEIVIHKF